MKRREFLTGTAAVGLAAACAPTAAKADGGSAMPKLTPPNPPAQLNLCLQWGMIPGNGFNAKLDYLESHGYNCVELPADAKWDCAGFNKAMEGRKLTVATLCGPSDLSKADPQARQAEVDRLKSIIDVAGAVKSVGLIICPARGKPELPFKELRQDFVENTGRQMAEHAYKLGTSIVLEPLRRNETPFMRQVADAAAIARDMGKGCTVMGDFWHMALEETSFMGAFISAGKLLTHVHIASLKNRKIPGSDGDADNYIDGFKGLKLIGYRGAVSLEGGVPKGGNKEELLDNMVKLLREQWEQA